MEVKDDAELPSWLLAAIDKERQLIQQTNAKGGKQFSTALGSPGLRVYKLVESKLGWWGWDNGTGGYLLSRGTGPWLNHADIDAEETKERFFAEEIDDLRQALAAERAEEF